MHAAMSTPIKVVNDLGTGKEQVALVRMVEDLLSIVPKEDLAGLDRVVLQYADQVAQAVATSPEGFCEPSECLNWNGYYQGAGICFDAYIVLNIDKIQFKQGRAAKGVIQESWRWINRRVFLAGQLYHPLFGCITRHIEFSYPEREFPDDLSRQVYIFQLKFQWIRKRFYLYILPMLAQLLKLQTWKEVRENLRSHSAPLIDVHPAE
jgi:hypothetical protein